MDDMTITRLCAEAMGYVSDGKWPNLGVYISIGAATVHYDPLRDDAQCFALVKKFEFIIEPEKKQAGGPWGITIWNDTGLRGKGRLIHTVRNATDLNRAVCECVARMQQAKN